MNRLRIDRLLGCFGMFVCLVAAMALAAPVASAQSYSIDVQSGGPGTVSPSGSVVVPAGGSQTFTFTPSGCYGVGEVTVDDVPVGVGITEYTFTNVQSDHVLYVPFGPRSTATALDVRPAIGQCAVPETLTATISNSDGGDVQFFNGTTLLGTRTLASGAASYIVAPGLVTGSYSLSAGYVGTSCSAPSISPTVAYHVADAGPIPVTLTLIVIPQDPGAGIAVLGASLWLGGALFDTQSGTVVFYDNGFALGGPIPMTGGYVSPHLFGTFSPGVHVITAVAHPSPCIGTVASQPETLIVTDPGTHTTLTLSISPPIVAVGGSVTLSAVINPSEATGPITFNDITNSVEVGSAPLVNGVATLTYGPLSGSSRMMQARYDGGAGYYGSLSNEVLLQIDRPTATLLAQFDATPVPDGIELRWSFGDASQVSSATVERSPNTVGPWAPITPELHHDGDVTAALDRAADSGQTYFYRLNVRLVDGSNATFGPISSTGSASISESTVNLLGSNPARGASQIQYAVARAGHVRLEVADVAGRVVTTLFDGVQPVGRFHVAWDGTNRGERLPAGLYFLRLTTLDRTVARKITRLP